MLGRCIRTGTPLNMLARSTAQSASEYQKARYQPRLALAAPKPRILTIIRCREGGLSPGTSGTTLVLKDLRWYSF